MLFVIERLRRADKLVFDTVEHMMITWVYYDTVIGLEGVFFALPMRCCPLDFFAFLWAIRIRSDFLLSIICALLLATIISIRFTSRATFCIIWPNYVMFVRHLLNDVQLRAIFKIMIWGVDWIFIHSETNASQSKLQPPSIHMITVTHMWICE